jgi:hypothetical protein
MGVNEFSPKPPDLKVLPQPVAPPKDPQGEIAEWRTKFGLDGWPPATDRSPQPAAAVDKNGADRRSATERALDAQLPVPSQKRAEFERSPVREFEKDLVAQGFPANQVDGLRQALRENPELCVTLGGSKAGAEMLRDFSRVGTVLFERYNPPRTPEVDALVHKAVGKQPGEYVSQRDLDGLLKAVAGDRKSLLGKGLSDQEVDRVTSYLVRDTGRVLRLDLPQPVMTSDGMIHANAEDGIQHDRRRMINATVEAPGSTGVARLMGAGLDTVEHVGGAAKLIYDVAGKFTKRTSEVRKGITAAEQPHVPETPRNAADRQ